MEGELTLMLSGDLMTALVELVKGEVLAELIAPVEYMSTVEVAEYLGLDSRAVDRLCARGVLPFHSFCPGGRRFFIKSEVDAYIRGLPGL
jgi:excisionase family DNA binding protein